MFKLMEVVFVKDLRKDKSPALNVLFVSQYIFMLFVIGGILRHFKIIAFFSR